LGDEKVRLRPAEAVLRRDIEARRKAAARKVRMAAGKSPHDR